MCMHMCMYPYKMHELQTLELQRSAHVNMYMYVYINSYIDNRNNKNPKKITIHENQKTQLGRLADMGTCANALGQTYSAAGTLCMA